MITSIVMDWQGLGGGRRIDSAFFNERYIVTFDDSDDPRVRPQMALGLKGETAPDDSPVKRVPQMFEQHPYNPWLYVQDTPIKILGPMVFEVDVTYGNQGQSNGGGGGGRERQLFANPCEQPWEVEWDTISIPQNINMAFDDNGNLTKHICTANLETYDPPLQENVEFPILRVTRNQEEWDDKRMALFPNHTNSDFFLGWSPGNALCQKARATRMRAANLFYWRANIEIVFSVLPWGWQRHLKHEGYQEAIWNGDTGKREIVWAVDDHGERVPLPVPLRLDGTRIFPPLPGEEPESAVAIDFTTKEKIPFLELGIT